MTKPKQSYRGAALRTPPAQRRTIPPAPPPYVIGQLPLTLTSDDMARVFQLTKRTFYRHQSLGRFRKFELRDRAARVGYVPRYSGPLVMRFLEARG